MKKDYSLRDCGERADLKASPEYCSLVANLQLAAAEYLEICQTPRGLRPKGCLSFLSEPEKGIGVVSLILVTDTKNATEIVDYLEDRIYD